jgi:hypothetical protein
MDLREEAGVLRRLVYKSKNQHKNTIYFRKMVHLKRALGKVFRARTPSLRRVAASDAREIAAQLYIAASSNIPDGYFLGVTVLTLALAARIFRELDTPGEKETSIISPLQEIDDIFG